MEDFYPITNEDLTSLLPLIRESLMFQSSQAHQSKPHTVAFLLPLAVDLISDVDKIREFKSKLEEQREEITNDRKLIDGFLEILNTWLEENNGNGNLLKIIKVLLLNNHKDVAHTLEEFIIQYSLPSTSEADNSNVYSTSREFFLEEVKKVEVDQGIAVERALQNSVILEEVFKKLQPRDQKSFRLVCPTWSSETFSYWRRTSKLRIHAQGTYFYDPCGISMISFVNLLKLEGNGDGSYKLLEHPFHSYQISYDTCSDHLNEGTPLCGDKSETLFWELNGHRVENLQIDNAAFDHSPEDRLYKICKRILLEACVNLKKLKISDTCNLEGCNITSDDEDEQEEGSMEESEAKPKKVAANLHTLHLDLDVGEKSLRKILHICPNLKTLILDTEGEISALMLPTANGKHLKLEKLSLHYFGYVTDNFISLRNYVETSGFNSLQHITLTGISLISARRPPFNLYTALARCNNLKTIELDMRVILENDLEGNRKWFTDLSHYSFPNLAVFKLTIGFTFVSRRLRLNRNQGRKFEMKFDFGTLKGMKNLEQLEIKVRNSEEKVERNCGDQDWIFHGDMIFLPVGITQHYSEGPILCSKLKQFVFNGWCLSTEDITLLAGWFPNLTQLEAMLQPPVFLHLLEKWEGLKKLNILTEEMISLRQLRPLKEKRKCLQISQFISGERILQCLELKERNDRIYFIEKAEFKERDDE